MSRFLVTPDDHIFNYYVLPLLGVSKESFGSSFIRTFLNRKCDLVFVEVSSFSHQNTFVGLPNYKEMFDYKGQKFYIFNVPDTFKEDIILISKGAYSKICTVAKEFIKKYSGLANNYPSKSGAFVTSKAIFALDRHPALIQFFAKELGLTPAEVDEYLVKPQTELMQIPNDEDFIEVHLGVEKSV